MTQCGLEELPGETEKVGDDVGFGQRTGAEAWLRALAASGLPPLHTRRNVGDNFRASLAVRDVGPLRLVDLVTPAGQCFRDTRSVRDTDDGMCQIEVVAEGRVLVEQDGNQAELGPSDLVVIDPARPVRLTSTATNSLTLMVPRQLLRLGRDDLARLAAVRVRGDHGPGALVSSLVRGTARSVAGLRAAEAARWGNALVELVAVALSAQLGGASRATDDSLRARILAFIETRLPDRGLTPASVAAAHHISVRRLHKLFEGQPSTVAALIRRNRLDKCRDALADPACRQLTVAAVAARWGFTDPAHFSRLFKTAYGHTPAEERTMHYLPTTVHG